ncbi:SDR family NAD(P)-dependent oxidoreductase [Nonomuraea aurantiaca]|uniref:SDR family NAD(P)-dependent oxidoreductase n=1 Tax=Nonomuraea aurantiaca TaxID=2878562 RepID=UPI001CD98F8F|nr:SDR family NAD(P)-dependent oxidoreductase [Nonomuraea aurantiaca]MCA2226590.1 SDR family oxidoreductase [Nonomuraea aurantiaca]
MLITGGAGGIGAAIARRMARKGSKVIIADKERSRGEEVAAEIGARFVPADVCRPEDNEAAVAEAISAYGTLDVAVLNAGIPGQCGWHNFTPAAYRATIATNLDGIVYGIHACLPHLRGGGSIIVTSSLAGLKEAPDPFYAASKHALIGLVRSTATLLAGDGVKVNALCPGLVDTPLLAPFRELLTEAGHTFASPDEAADAVEAILADGRTGQAWVVLNGRPAYPARFPDVTTGAPDGCH